MPEVPGDLVFDESVFDDQYVNATWEEVDLDNWFAAPVGGLNFNDNCVDITVTPPSRLGALVSVAIRPECSIVKVVNECRAGRSGTPVLRHRHDSFEYRISERCPKRWTFGPVSFPDPGLLTADAFRTTLRRKGIACHGTLKRQRVRRADGSIPATLTVLDHHRTPIAEVLRRTGKDSQNVFAEALLKRTGYAWAQRRGLPVPQGSWAMGSRAILDVMEVAGVNVEGLAIADGSGLSRANRCTARQLTSTLSWMATQPGARLFLESLSIAGVDGSLRKRLKDVPDRVFGKTGTMRGIRTLSGYVESTSGRRFAFAVLFNGYPGPSTPYREIQDRICRILIGA